MVIRAQEVDVRLLDDGKEWWRDFVVPTATLIAALVGGLGGVLIGGKMNRTTLSKLEGERAERESALEDARAARELAGHRRQALGAMRVLMAEFERVKTRIEQERDRPGEELLPEVMDKPLRIRPEELHALAIWLPDEAWTGIALNLDMLEENHLNRSVIREFMALGGTPDLDAYRSELSRIVTLLDAQRLILELHLDRLRADAPQSVSGRS